MNLRSLLNAYRDYFYARPEPKVQEWVGVMDWEMDERSLEPKSFAATRHLEAIPKQAPSPEQDLIDLICEMSSIVQWRQSYNADDFGAEFLDNFTTIELFGTRGHFKNEMFAGGFVLYGPDTHYPNHWHEAEEIYFPLTSDSVWGRNNEPVQPKQSGEFIFHTSNMPHEMIMKETPLLALWMWHGGDLAQKCDH